MKLAFIISSNNWYRGSLEDRLVRKYGIPVCPIPFPADREPLPDPNAVGSWVVEQFERIANGIEEFALQHGGAPVLRDAVALIEFCSPTCRGWENVALLHESDGAALSVAGLLMFAFPEIHWFLQTPYSAPDVYIARAHVVSAGCDAPVLVAKHAAGCLSLFDPAGLRQRLRLCLHVAADEAKDEHQQSVYRIREEVAAVIDEEETYAYFNSLALFRSGYRSLAVTRWRSMREWLSDGEERAPHSPAVSFEDLYLSFPDRPQYLHQKKLRLSLLRSRDRVFERLGSVKRRNFVTVGHQRGGDHLDRWEDNKDYIAERAYTAHWVFKPVAGIYRLLNDSGLRKPAQNFKLAGTSSSSVPRVDADDLPHSAPGRLLMVCDRLLARSSRLLDERTSMADAVHAAVLAIEARELIADQTPTTSLEAVALKHEAEAVAESLFVGVQYNLSLKERFLEIESEVGQISQWFHKSQTRRSAINARLTIVERLASRFRDLNQIEEELACLAEARRLRFEFWVRERPWRWLLWPVLRYISFALGSLPHFGVVVALTLLVFGTVYFVFASWAAQADWLQLSFLEKAINSLSASAFFTFTLQPAENWSQLFKADPVRGALWNLLQAFHGAFAFTNLGLLLSHLYMTVSRR